MKKALKWTGIVLLTPVLLFVILAALLYVPPIQNWVAQQVASIASEKTGMDISVEHVDLSFPLDLSVDGVRIVKDQDTIADIRRTVVDVRLWPLLKGNIVLNELELNEARLNTLNFIDDLRLDGTIGTLTLSSPGIDASAMEMELRRPHISNANLTVYMSDTAAVDTTTTGWHIRFDRFDFEQTQLNIVMDSAARFDTPSTTRIGAYLGQASMRDGDLHLGLVRFVFGPIDWQQGRLSYDDAVAMSDVTLQLDSLYSYKDVLRVGVAQASMNEDSTGVSLHALQGRIAMNGDDISVDSLHVVASAPWDGNDALLHARLHGDTRRMDINELSVSIPTVAHAEATGTLTNILNTSELQGQLDVSADIYQTLRAGDACLPKGLSVQANVATTANRVNADVALRHGSGTARMEATTNQSLAALLEHPGSVGYNVRLTSRQLNLQQFLPTSTLGTLTAEAQLSGQGIPRLDSPQPTEHGARLTANAKLHNISSLTSPGSTGPWQMDSVEAAVTLNGSHLVASAISTNKMLRGSMDIDAQVASKHVSGTIHADLPHADLHALGIATEPTVVGFNGDIRMQSDLQRHHSLTADLCQMTISDTLNTHHPEDLHLQFDTTPDTTIVDLSSGDLQLRLDAQNYYEDLLGQLAVLGDTISSQLKHRTIDQPALKQLLPTARLNISGKKGNPLAGILEASMGIAFKEMNANLQTSPLSGLNGKLELHEVSTESMRLDTMRLSLVERGQHLSFNGQVANTRRNPTGAFNILFDGLLQQHGASIGVRYFDEQGLQNIRIGAKAEMVAIPQGDHETTGLRFQVIPARPTLGYKEFAVNDDNFLLLHDDLRIEANVDLLADDGTHIFVYSGDVAGASDDNFLQDITISINNLDLGELTGGLVILPAISGMLSGDYHLMMDQQHNISVACDMGIAKMAYEGCPIGNLGSEMVYLLREDGTHVVDAVLELDDAPIGTLQGSYDSKQHLDATLQLDHMPLSIVNGFMPDQIIGFEGTADGTLTVRGATQRLQMDGELRFTDGYLVSNPYSMRMRFGDKPLQLKDSKLILDQFTLYADNSRQQNETPLTINGSVDFYGDGPSAVNLRLMARNFPLINSKQKKESVAYGRMFVNVFARLSGNLSQLQMRGRLEVLGTTDLNYVLLDSPLSTDSQMDELVRFTDFSDTTNTVIVRQESDALDLDVQLNIDQGAHVRCALNSQQTNYVDLLGGGDLRLRINNDGLRLTGRYTISSGTMKYSLPIIPLKTFTLAEGSYVEFSGQPDNPKLNITATERTRATMTTANDGQTRYVSFDCGVIITQTLENMGLQFTISAPEDTQVQSELSAMGAEQRGKLAVTMLTTGMYLIDGNTGNFSMNTALSSFLQNEINNITAGALKTVDLQLGLDNSTDATGQTRTDYSFSFAKRFWNNRLSVQLGGKVSSGAEVQGQQQSFFDNVTMEYRLSPTGNQYVKLFYNQNVYDWLEGYTGKYGGGFIWKRKLDNLLDIFRKTPARSATLRMGNMRTPQRTDSLQRTEMIVPQRTDSLPTTNANE